MKIELKRLHSPDIIDLKSFKPEEENNFSFLLQFFVGIEDEEGEETFSLEVCSPAWIEDNYDIDDVLIGRHHIIIQQYNYDKLLKFIVGLIDKCPGDNWNDITNKLSRFGLYEFEDYIEYKEKGR